MQLPCNQILYCQVPYQPSSAVNPIGVYGESKLAGEESVRAILPDKHVIIRTSWVYSSHGSNFVKTMLRLMSEKDQLNVVYDQVACPTMQESWQEFATYLLVMKISMVLIIGAIWG